MKLALLQMNMKLSKPDENYVIAERLIHHAMEKKPDVLVLPECWNTGFFPKHNLRNLSCDDGDAVKLRIGNLANQYGVNIIAGSVSNIRDDKVYNTAFIFNRNGECIAEYDKTHLFTPMDEDKYYTRGDHLCRFILDGIQCGLIICYDLRFPELVRKLALQGLDVLFVVAEWPKIRTFHLHTLTAARAIENQIFVACCNSCGTAENIVYGGHSIIVNPFGETLALAGETEEILFAECNMQLLTQVRNTIPVFRDRRPELY